MFEGAKRYAPFLLPYLYTFYSRPSKLSTLDRDLILYMHTGVQQGDPLGSLLFCLGLNIVLEPLLTSIPLDSSAIKILLFVDDIFILGTTASSTLAIAEIRKLLPDGNLTLGSQRGKNTFISPSLSQDFSDIEAMGVQKVPCLDILGAPLGGVQECVEWLEHKLLEYQRVVQLHAPIVHEYPHESLELYLKTITPQLNYICRCLPVLHPRFAFFARRTRVLDANYVLNLLRIPLFHTDEVQSTLRIEHLGLPKSSGGAGFRFLADIGNSAYLGSWASVYRSALEHKQHLLPIIERTWLDQAPSLHKTGLRMALQFPPYHADRAC
jgi:hypothetical protein